MKKDFAQPFTTLPPPPTGWQKAFQGVAVMATLLNIAFIYVWAVALSF
jgi:hypothetical protein